MGKSGGLCPLVVSGVLSTRVPGRGEMCFRLRGRRLRSRIINYRGIFPIRIIAYEIVPAWTVFLG